jgi:hypothetical protein
MDDDGGAKISDQAARFILPQQINAMASDAGCKH